MAERPGLFRQADPGTVAIRAVAISLPSRQACTSRPQPGWSLTPGGVFTAICASVLVWAKYADALRRISLACRSSRFSRSSAFSCSTTSAGTPGVRPLSQSAFFTHSCSVCAVQPILAAIDTIAAHCEACSPRCSSTYPDGTLTHLCRKLRGCSVIRHGSSLSRVGASDKSGVVHIQRLLRGESAMSCASG